MAGLLSRFAVSERAKKRLRVISVVMLGVVAALSWWAVVEDGPSAARVILAIVSSVAAVVQAVDPRGRRAARRLRSSRPS